MYLAIHYWLPASKTQSDGSWYIKKHVIFMHLAIKDTQERQWPFAVSAAICLEQVRRHRKIPMPRNV
jgi:hypothetical protein